MCVVMAVSSVTAWSAGLLMHTQSVYSKADVNPVGLMPTFHCARKGVPQLLALYHGYLYVSGRCGG